MLELTSNRTIRRPMIGVVPSHSEGAIVVTSVYLNAVWQAGGFPVPLAYTTDGDRLGEYAAHLDGFLFSGGGDLDPSCYGEETDPDAGVAADRERDAFEARLFAAVYPTGKPILGICRGIQSVNVWLGGTLRQHIDGHRQREQGIAMELRSHGVTVEEGSLFHRICGRTEVTVNSSHHQVVKDLAPALVPDGYSEDGYLEAAHAPDHPFLFAVQFHPECYCTAQDDDHAAAIFRAFVEACAATDAHLE